MADEQPKKKGKKIAKLLLMLFLLLVLIIGGFVLGIYLRLFDTQEANEKLGLYKLPVIGQYFVKPAPSPNEMENTPVEDVKPSKEDKKESKKITISKKEIENSTNLDIFEECHIIFTKYFTKFNITNYENFLEKIKTLKR